MCTHTGVYHYHTQNISAYIQGVCFGMQIFLLKIDRILTHGCVHTHALYVRVYVYVYAYVYVCVCACTDNRGGGGIGNAYMYICGLQAHARHGTPPSAHELYILLYIYGIRPSASHAWYRMFHATWPYQLVLVDTLALPEAYKLK